MTAALNNAVIDFLITQSKERSENYSDKSPNSSGEYVAIFDELDSLSLEEFSLIYTMYLLGEDLTCPLGTTELKALAAGFEPLEKVAGDSDLHTKLSVGKERWLHFAKQRC